MAELRLIAEASQDPLWLNSFNNGEDLHAVLCSKLFKIPITDVKKPFPLKPDITYRDVIKTINFGLAYGMSEYKLSNTIKVTKEEALKIINEYFEVVPLVEQYLKNSGNFAKKYGVSYTIGPIKRPRYFDMEILKSLTDSEKKIRLGSYERQGKNSAIQGANSDWIKLSIIYLYNFIQEKKYPAKLVLTVHDELVSSVREDLAEEWLNIQEEQMIKAGRFFIKSIPIVVESKIGDYWQK